ncbi:MAG: hypothetical protein AM326_08545 [Candidatus Thorarchaeota archaeon SMTZ-45]|nr:MAG: hypothetical protein AM326_08545 [Candidatus Thorarchaeota archaeon SMTZ-45]
MNLAHVWLNWKIHEIYRFDMDIEILKSTPQKLEKGVIFWQWHFNFQKQGGYIGLQLLSSGKKAIFSIWDAIEGKSPCCPFSHEGKGVQCLIDFEWKLEQKYRLRVSKASKPKDTTWWIGEIYDYSDGTSTTIGEVCVPHSFGKLSAYNYYTCIEYGYFDSETLPCTKSRFSGHYAYNGKEDGPASLRAESPKVEYPNGEGTSKVTLCRDSSYIIEAAMGNRANSDGC